MLLVTEADAKADAEIVGVFDRVLDAVTSAVSDCVEEPLVPVTVADRVALVVIVMEALREGVDDRDVVRLCDSSEVCVAD